MLGSDPRRGGRASGTRFFMLFLYSSLPAWKAPSHAVMSRRSALAATGAALFPTASHAFDLPPPDGLVAAFNPYDAEALKDPSLAKKYADMPSPDKGRQQSAAYFAVSNGDTTSLQAMADGGWNLAELADDNGKTLLHRAAQIGNEPAITLLLKAGCPIDAYTTFQETPLHLAVRNHKLASVKLLVESGASTSALYSTNGDTALTLAKKYKFVDVVDYLKSKGAGA